MAGCEGPRGRAHMQTVQQQAERRQITGLPTWEHYKGHGTSKTKAHMHIVNVLGSQLEQRMCTVRAPRLIPPVQQILC